MTGFAKTLDDVQLSSSFRYVEDNYLALAELSIIDFEFLKDIVKEGEDETWVFFNRLIVPPAIRNRGVATKLMEQVIEWADEEKINIFNGVNAYGDLNLPQLIRFYSKFGFKKLSKATMIRMFKR